MREITERLMEEREKSGMEFDDFLGQLAVFRQVRMSTNMKSFGGKITSA